MHCGQEADYWETLLTPSVMWLAHKMWLTHKCGNRTTCYPHRQYERLATLLYPNWITFVSCALILGVERTCYWETTQNYLTPFQFAVRFRDS